MSVFLGFSGKRFSVFRGNAVEETKEAGGMSRMDDFSARSWGGLGRSWRSFCLIFSCLFFTSIFHRFFLDFGGVWEGFGEAKGTPKSRFLVVLGLCFSRH